MSNNYASTCTNIVLGVFYYIVTMLLCMYSIWLKEVISFTKKSNKQEGNADPTLEPDFFIFLLLFKHKWMFLSTMQTLPNQIPLGPAKMISLLSFSIEWGFLFLLNMYMSAPIKKSVPKDFGLLCVWFTKFTLY